MHTFTVPDPALTDRAAMAREQSALFPARLALARWTSGLDLPGADRSRPPRAAWYAQAERNFQAWLDQGGFTQYDGMPSDSDPPVADGQAHSANVCIG